MTGNEITSDSFSNLKDVKQARMDIVRESLRTTEKGQCILATAGDNDEILEDEIITVRHLTDMQLAEVTLSEVSLQIVNIIIF